ncbi:hypothetical protein ACGYKD_16635 [Sulfitobacter sp. TB366]|uniref:hypothetical protein n=1 Tax=Sulfitobacter sp. TB366 TaxID=3368580 RepID=UPI00374517F1
MTTVSCTSPAVTKKELSKLAKELAYTDEEIAAGIEYANRAKRRSPFDLPLGGRENDAVVHLLTKGVRKLKAELKRLS